MCEECNEYMRKLAWMSLNVRFRPNPQDASIISNWSAIAGTQFRRDWSPKPLTHGLRQQGFAGTQTAVKLHITLCKPASRSHAACRVTWSLPRLTYLHDPEQGRSGPVLNRMPPEKYHDELVTSGHTLCTLMPQHVTRALCAPCLHTRHSDEKQTSKCEDRV